MSQMLSLIIAKFVPFIVIIVLVFIGLYLMGSTILSFVKAKTKKKAGQLIKAIASGIVMVTYAIVCTNNISAIIAFVQLFLTNLFL